MLGVHAAWAAAEEPVSVPQHLRDTHYRGHENLGSGEGYKYPHDFPGHYVQQQYMPDGLEDREFFVYGDQGAEAEMSRRQQNRKNGKERETGEE